MASIKIVSKQNGVAIVLPTSKTFFADPDGDFVAEAGAISTQISIKRSIDDFYIIKNIDYTYIRDSGGVQIGTSRDNCVSVLNSNYLNRTSKIQELDNVDFQNTIAADQVLKFVDVGGGILRISNELEQDVVDELVAANSISAVDKTTIQTNIGVDPSGTDNSTDVSINANANDVLRMAPGQVLGAQDAAADKLVFWDDTANKLTYATIGANLTMSSGTLSASGGGGGGGSFNGAGSFFMTGFTSTTTSQYYGFYTQATTMRDSGNWQHYMIWHVPKAGQIDHVSIHVQGGTQVKFAVWKASSILSNVQIQSTPTYEQTIPYTSANYTEVFSPTGWSFAAGDELAFAYYNVTGNAAYYVTVNICYSFT